MERKAIQAGVRFIDRALHAQRVAMLGPDPLGLTERELNATLQQAWSQSQVIVADNVLEYYYSNPSKDWNVVEDFETVMPPYDVCWVEAVVPQVYRDLHPNDEVIHASGLLMQSLRFDSLEQLDLNLRGAWAKGNERYIPAARCANRIELLQVQPHEPSPHYYLLSGFALGEPMKWHPMAMACFAIVLNANGKPVSAISMQTVGNFRGLVGETKFADMAGDEVMPMLLTMALMNCKNVKRVPVEPSAKLNKAHTKRRGRPLVRYSTLVIDPMKEVIRSEGGGDANGLPRALHMVRRHFKTYTKEKPLFGKVHGTFWVPAHVRGNLKEGAVIKDYAVQGGSHPAPK